MKFIIYIIFLFLLSCGTILDDYKISGVWDLIRSEAYIYDDKTLTYKLVNIEAGDFFYTDSDEIQLIFSSSKELAIVDKSDPTDEFIVIPDNGRWNIDFSTSSIVIDIRKESRAGYENKYNIWSNGFKFSTTWPLTSENEMELLISSNEIKKNIEIYKTNTKANFIKCYLKKI